MGENGFIHRAPESIIANPGVLPEWKKNSPYTFP
jgi:hypothetical protein